MKGKSKYFFKKPLVNMSKAEIDDYLELQVFDTAEFKDHVKEVAFNLKVDQQIVTDVLKHYFSTIMYICNTKRKLLTKINVYGFFSLFVEKGDRI